MLKGGGTIPYKPEALKQRNENRAKWPESDNEAKCYMLGIPRYTYHKFRFRFPRATWTFRWSIRSRQGTDSFI